MSLDVFLSCPGVPPVRSGPRIWEHGQRTEISRAEWDERYPGREPVTVEDDGTSVYEANITHRAPQTGTRVAEGRP